MDFRMRCKLHLNITFLAAFAFLLISCGTITEQNVQEISNEIIITPTLTTSPTATVEVLSSPTHLFASATPMPSTVPSATMTSTPEATIALSPTSTHTRTPLQIETVVPCENENRLPDKTFPVQLDMTRSGNRRVAISHPFLYLAVDQYIGVFDISDPTTPQILGFWDFPDWPNISNFQVHQGVAYFTSGSTLVILNLSVQCQFETIATLEMPFQAYRLNIEGDRLYVGGTSENTKQSQIVVLSTDNPNEAEVLGVVDLGQGSVTWSVFEETIYVLGGKLAAFDVTDPVNPLPQPVNLTLDPETKRYSPAIFVEDRLYILWESHTLTLISLMLEEEPLVKRNPLQYIIMGDLSYFTYVVFENYIFLGGYSCDVSCGSYVTFFDPISVRELSGMGFSDDLSPIHSYHEVTAELIYAFSSDSLLVIDISDIAEPTILVELAFLS